MPWPMPCTDETHPHQNTPVLCTHNIITVLSSVRRVDKDRSGAITSDELQQALSNGKH
jgi:hypothetical protein